jgi:AcrR family transcriptional regulator
MSSDLEPLGLRERKKRKTRRLLQSTAMALFADRGFGHVTIDEIAAACDVSRTTVFRYFPTKEDLVVGTEPERLAELRLAFEQRPREEPVFDSVRHAVVALAERYELDRSQLLAAHELIASNSSLLARALEIHTTWVDLFAGLIASRTGNGTPDLRDRVLAVAVMAAMRVAIEEWLESEHPGELARLIADALDLLGEGFAPT